MIIKRIIYLKQSYYIDVQNKLEEYASRGLILVDIYHHEFIFEKVEPKNIKYEIIYANEEEEVFVDEDKWSFVAENEYIKVYSCEQDHIEDIQSRFDKLQQIRNNLSKPVLRINLRNSINIALNLIIIFILKDIPSILSSHTTLLMLILGTSMLVLFLMDRIEYICWYKKEIKRAEEEYNQGRNKIIRAISKFINLSANFILIATLCTYIVSLERKSCIIMGILVLIYFIPKILMRINYRKYMRHNKYKKFSEIFEAIILLVATITLIIMVIKEESYLQPQQYDFINIRQHSRSAVLEKTQGVIKNSIFNDEDLVGLMYCTVYKSKYNFVKELAVKYIDENQENTKVESIINDDIKVYKYSIPKEEDIGDYFISYKDYIIYVEWDSDYRVLSYIQENYDK